MQFLIMIKREKTRKNPKKWRLASLAASGGGGGGSAALGGVVPPPIGDACYRQYKIECGLNLVLGVFLTGV